MSEPEVLTRLKYAPLDPLDVPKGAPKVPERLAADAVPVKVPEFPSQYVKLEPASTVGRVQIVAVIAALLEGHPEEDA